MSTRITQEPLIIPKENLEIHSKMATKDGKIKSSKTTAKKGGAALGSRKALNDITNKSFLHPGTSRKKELPKEEDIDVAEEGFLHDHRKCIEEQKISSMHGLDLNLLLPGHDEFKSKSTNPLPEPEKMDLTNLHSFLDLEWLPESWRSETSVEQISPPSSPLLWESTSPVWKFEDVKFELRPENEV